MYAGELGAVPPDLVLARWSAFDRSCVDEFWNVWSAVAEAGLLGACQRARGPVSSGLQAFVGLSDLQIWRRLGGRAAGSRGASKLCRVSRGDDLDVSSAQYFVNSSLAPVLLLTRRVKWVADVL